MKIAVLGANGSLGRALVAEANARGHVALPVTRARADVVSGAGLREALAGADAVINAVNARSGDPRSVLLGGTKNAIAAAEAAGVGHYIGVSIVGIDRVPMAYYGVKVEEEKLVFASKVPWSLRRVTQFHDFVAALFERTKSYGFVLGFAGMSLQPIDVRDAAGLFVDLAEQGPSGRAPEAGGPEVLAVRELARRWLAATKRTRLVLPLPIPGLLGKSLRAGGLCTPSRAIGKRTFDAWLMEHVEA